MTLTGSHLIAGRESAPHGHFYHGVNPATSAKLEPAYADATKDEADEALCAAEGAFDAAQVQGTLAALCKGEAPRRQRPANHSERLTKWP